MADGIPFFPPLVPFRTDFHFGTYLWLCYDRNGCMLAVYSEEEHLLPVDYWDPRRRLYSISCYNYMNSLQPIANEILVLGLAMYGFGGVMKPEKGALDFIIVASRGISVAIANHTSGVPELKVIPRRKLMISALDSIGRHLASSAIADISIDEIEMDLVPSNVVEDPILDLPFLRSKVEDEPHPKPYTKIEYTDTEKKILEIYYREWILGQREYDPRQAIWSNIDYSQVVAQYGEIINKRTKNPWICEVDPDTERNLPAEFSFSSD